MTARRAVTTVLAALALGSTVGCDAMRDGYMRLKQREEARRLAEERERRIADALAQLTSPDAAIVLVGFSALAEEWPLQDDTGRIRRAVRALLRHPADAVRAGAWRLLANLPRPGADDDDIAAGLADASLEVRAATLAHLPVSGRAVSRYFAAALGGITPKRHVPALVAAVAEPALRDDALVVLSHVEEPDEATFLLLRAELDVECARVDCPAGSRVAMRLHESLAAHGRLDDLEGRLLEGFVAGEDAHRVAASAHVLGQIRTPSPATLATLVDLVDGDDERRSLSAMGLLRNLGDRGVGASPDVRSRMSAIAAAPVLTDGRRVAWRRLADVLVAIERDPDARRATWEEGVASQDAMLARIAVRQRDGWAP